MTLMLLLALGILLGLLLSAFCSATETGSYVLNRVQLRVLSEQNRPGARTLAAAMQRPDELIIALLLANTIADYVASNCLQRVVLGADLGEREAELITTAIMTPVVLVFGGIIPKDLFQRRADSFMYLLAVPLWGLLTLGKALGVIPLLRWITRGLVRWIDPSQADAEDGAMPRLHVRRLLHEGAARRGLSVFQRDLLDRVMNISLVRVGDVMIPRARAAMVGSDISRDDFLRVARMAHFSRLPMHQAGDPRRVLGIINVYDVIADAAEKPIRDYLRPAQMVHDGMPVSSALVKLQQNRQVMGIATDGSGNCVGLFTMKDLVEEIVGELEVW